MTQSVQGAIEMKLMDAFDYRSMIMSNKKANRKTIKLYPDNQTQVYNGVSGNKIKFNFPARGFLDNRNISLNFTARNTTTNTNPYTSSFNQWIESVINKVTITLGDGSSVCEKLEQYNINAVSKYKNEVSAQYASTLGTDLLGFGEYAERVTWGQQGRQYCVPLKSSGLFSGNLKYMPLGVLSMAGFNKSLVVEIELEQPQNCMVKSNVANLGNLSYEISNIYMQLELLEAPAYEDELMNAVKNGKTVALPYVTSNYWNFNIAQNQSGNMTFPILQYNQFVHNVRTIFTLPHTDITEYTNHFFRPANIQEYQYQINSKYWPNQAVELTANSNANADLEKYKCFNKLKDYENGSLISSSSTVPDQNSLTNGFMIAQTFKTFYDNEEFIKDSGNYSLDGVDTTDKSSIVFRLKTSGVQPQSLFMHNFVDYQSAIVVDRSGASIIN